MTAAQMSEHSAVKAQADLLHAYFLGLQLSVATQEGSTVMGDWMFSLFRRQHHEKFLSSFAKLGLSDLPHAVACAQYHVLSNNIGGVGVEYMAETDRKAWVRFRYPRWMYHGPGICGVPVEVSRGFLRGWDAHNGVSLGNPRLGFVCVSEDMTGDYGFIGYFQEYDHDLSDEERLQFEPDAVPPPFVGEDQPQPPPQAWNEARLEKLREVIDTQLKEMRASNEKKLEDMRMETDGLRKALIAERKRLADLNPQASVRMANRLLEASDRNYWQPDDETLAALQGAADDLEDRMEGIAAE